MNLPGFCVKRPVFTTMAALIVLILGGMSFSRLSVDLMPDISFPTLSVMTRYEYASPEEVEELITRPIEEAMGAVPGVEDISSSSTEGSSSVTINFAWGTNLDAAANDVRDRLDRVIPRLPDGADRPMLRKFDPAAFPILIMGASSRLDPIHMRRLIDEEIMHRIERVPGVAAMDVWGGHQREIHVDVDPDKLQILGLSMEQLVQRLRAANVTLPAGFIEEGQYEVTLRVPGEFRSLDELRDVTIAVRGGVPVRLDEVAEVNDHWRRIARVVRMNGVPGLRLSVSRQSEENTVAVARRVLAEVDRINREMPQIRLTPIVDTSEFIERSVANVRSAALFGGLFTLVILMLFLRSVRSTLIIAVVIPLSVVGTFTLIYFSGFTLNLMTLGGLALGVGMLVDNSIVVLENIYRKLDMGEDAASGATHGAREVNAAIVASTLTTLAVFVPLIFIRGMAGVMFRQLAFVVSFALLASLMAALTLIPMLSAKFLRSRRAVSDTGDRAAVGGYAFEGLENAYKRLLHWVLAHRLLVTFAAVLLLAGSVLLIPLVGTELMPDADEGEVRVNVEMEIGTRLAETDRIFQQVEDIVLREAPEIRNMVASVGGSPRPGAPGGSHLGNLRISLAPLAERDRSSDEVAGALRRALSQTPGVTLRVRTTQGLFLLRRMTGGDEQLDVEIRGHDLDTSNALAHLILDLVRDIPGVTDARISREIGSPERHIRVDRGKAEALGISVREVAGILQNAMTGARAGLYREGGHEVDIRVQLKDAERRPLNDILDMAVIAGDGSTVALRNIVEDERASGPTGIDRRNQERVVSVFGNIAGRDMGSVIADAREALGQVPVPQGFTVGIGGAYEEQQEAFNELAVGLVLALVLVYMVMACLYESLRDPFIVMFSVPLAIIGVVMMLFLTGTTFNIQSFIGCIMLGGIVVNNAILLVDTANHLHRDNGLTLREAVEEAGRRRLRPILMTALTTMCGLLPLALGMGEGGEMQAPMARAVIGGLLSSTFVTLLFVPVVYTVFEAGNGVRTRATGGAVRNSAAAVSLLLAGVVALQFAAGCTTGPLLPPPHPMHGDVRPPTVPSNADGGAGPVIGAAPMPAAPDPLSLTSDEAVLMALENNRNMRVVRFEPVIRREQETIQHSVFDPVVSVQASERRTRTAARDGAGDRIDDAGTVLNGDVSFLHPLGTRWTAEAGLERARRGGDELFMTRLGMGIHQPVLRGAGRHVNLAELHQARLDTRLSEYELRGVAESLAAEVERVYWAYSLALQRIDIVEESLRLAERQLAETRQRIRVGNLPATEEAAAETEVALRREARIDAVSRVEILRVRLLRLVDPDRLRWAETRLHVDNGPRHVEGEIEPLEAHLGNALRHRPDLNQARLRVERGQVGLVRTANGLLPRMDLFLRLGKTGYAESFGASVADLDGDGYDATAGIAVEWPAGNRAARARHRLAMWTHEQVVESMRNVADLIREDVHVAYAEVLRAREQVQAKAATRMHQEETVRAESAKFAAGHSTALLVAQAQRELLAARVAEAEAVIEHRQALTDLFRLDGTLLMRRGIVAPGAAGFAGLASGEP